MPLASSALSLDIVKSPFAARSQRVCVRVGDRGAYRLSVELLKDGSPLPMSGLSATLKAVLADGTYAEAACAVDDASAGLVSCTLGGAFASVPGACREAYVEVAQGASVVGSTGSFELLVERGADLSAGQAKAYASRVDALAERAEGLADGLEETIASADIAVSATRLDPGSDPTATVTGSGLAKHVELGIPSAAAGVSCEAGPADMVTVHGAADDAPLVGAVVYGETRRNLWPELGAADGGISISTGDDGTLSVSGTLFAVSASAFASVYNIKPSTTYTVSSDIDISGLKNGLFVQFDGVTTWLLGSVGNGKSKTFTTPESFSTVTIGIECWAEAGTVYSFSFKVMLNEGASPAPWSPPGLASVEEVEARACGGNLLPPFPKSSMGTYGGVTFSESEDGFIKISGSNLYDTGVTLPDTGPNIILKKGEYVLRVESINNMNGIYVRLRLNAFYGENPIGDIKTAGDYNFTLLKTEKIYTSPAVHGIGQPGHENSVSSSVRISIYKKNDYTGKYERYSGSTCPVPLPAAHPYLASLPDGTRDELRINWDGTAELVANTFTDTVDGSSPIISDINNGRIRFKISSSHEIGTSNGAEYSRRNAFCNKLKVNNDPVNKNNSYYNIAAHEPNSAFYFNLGENEDSLDKAKTWLSSNELIILYKIASPIHYFYDGTAWSTTRPAVGSLPALRSAGDPTHVWAATEPTSVPAEVGAHVLLEGGKALGAEHDYVRRAVDALAAAQSVSESE